MLRYRGIPNAQKRGEFADRAFALDQLTQDQKPVAVRQRLEKLAGGIGGGLHLVGIYFHTCVYTYY